MLQYLCLSGNKIKSIGEDEFIGLPKLKWISLAGNEIEELPHRIFGKNSRLEYIDLGFNKISLINPKFFDSLLNLIEVCLEKNSCVDQKFKRNDPVYPIELMKQHLDACFQNYLIKYGEDEEAGEIAVDQEAVSYNSNLTVLRHTFFEFLETKLPPNEIRLCSGRTESQRYRN
jgi:Leucine-rich repeat (LRR) protein